MPHHACGEQMANNRTRKDQGRTQLESPPPRLIECLSKIPPTYSDVVQDAREYRDRWLSLAPLQLADVCPVHASPGSQCLLGQTCGEAKMPENGSDVGGIGKRTHGESK